MLLTATFFPAIYPSQIIESSIRLGGRNCCIFFSFFFCWNQMFVLGWIWLAKMWKWWTNSCCSWGFAGIVLRFVNEVRHFRATVLYHPSFYSFIYLSVLVTDSDPFMLIYICWDSIFDCISSRAHLIFVRVSPFFFSSSFLPYLQLSIWSFSKLDWANPTACMR